MTCFVRLAAWWFEQVVGTVFGNPPLTARERARIDARIDHVHTGRFPPKGTP